MKIQGQQLIHMTLAIWVGAVIGVQPEDGKRYSGELQVKEMPWGTGFVLVDLQDGGHIRDFTADDIEMLDDEGGIVFGTCCRSERVEVVVKAQDGWLVCADEAGFRCKIMPLRIAELLGYNQLAGHLVITHMDDSEEPDVLASNGNGPVVQNKYGMMYYLDDGEYIIGTPQWFMLCAGYELVRVSWN